MLPAVIGHRDSIDLVVVFVIAGGHVHDLPILLESQVDMLEEQGTLLSRPDAKVTKLENMCHPGKVKLLQRRLNPCTTAVGVS